MGDLMGKRGLQCVINDSGEAETANWSQSLQQVDDHFVDGTKLTEGMLNRVSAVVRAYDPCLSCSRTPQDCCHADSPAARKRGRSR